MPPGRANLAAKQPPGPRAITEHPIRREDIHSNVYYVCQRLREHGHTALLVGGAVRDLLLGRSPKDFDLATSARPEAVKQLFRNARIIGRRFKLVQLRYPNMAMEVATFRGEPRDKRTGMIRRDNRYGTSEEDARRRDFTINALTFDPLTLTLFDYVGGMEDLGRRRIRTIKPPEESYREDPVRMMRAVRFKVRLGFEIDRPCEDAIRRCAGLLGEVTRHRMAEETQRFLTRGDALPAYAEFDRLGLLGPLLAVKGYGWIFSDEATESPLERLQPYLRRMDAWLAGGGETIAPTVALLGLLVTLGNDALRGYLTGADDRKQAAFARQLDKQLAPFLADWGLLNGQVLPALSILEAARTLVTGHWGVLANHDKAVAITGIREALLLTAILQDVLELEQDAVQAAVAHLPRLPDLPILDHPRPAQRGHRLQEGDQGPGRAKPPRARDRSARRGPRAPR